MKNNLIGEVSLITLMDKETIYFLQTGSNSPFANRYRSISPFENLSVEEARISLEQRKNSIRDLTLFGPQDFITMDPALIESYMNRVRTVGEYEATKWLMERTKKENP